MSARRCDTRGCGEPAYSRDPVWGWWQCQRHGGTGPTCVLCLGGRVIYVGGFADAEPCVCTEEGRARANARGAR